MKKYLPIFIAVVIAGGLGLFVGSKIAPSGAPGEVPGGFAGAARMGAGRGMTAQGGFVTGEVLSKDASSITVKLRNGGSTIVFYSGSTAVMKSVSGSTADLSAGDQVSVAGSSNSDGSVTAKTIDIRPTAMPGASGNSTSTR